MGLKNLTQRRPGRKVCSLVAGVEAMKSCRFLPFPSPHTLARGLISVVSFPRLLHPSAGCGNAGLPDTQVKLVMLPVTEGRNPNTEFALGLGSALILLLSTPLLSLPLLRNKQMCLAANPQACPWPCWVPVGHTRS